MLRHKLGPLVCLILVCLALPRHLASACANPGRDGSPGTLSGVINTYWQGTANAAAGSTTITLGASAGSATTITAGDLVLIIQMQDGSINYLNSSSYGDGTGIGSGLTSIGNAGLYEYAVAASGLPAAGGTLTITGGGAGGGLINSYFNADATATTGQQRFQVIRVPQYANATLGNSLSCLPWQGSFTPAVAWVGGVLAMDVSGTLTLGSATVSVDGLGFRAGMGRQLAGNTGNTTGTDFVNSAAYNAHGNKGEGIIGTPQYVYTAAGTGSNIGYEGLPAGSTARGAPGTGGGGGTDPDPTANDQNDGGGGGANGGGGGHGGNSWFSNLPEFGMGGSAFPAALTRMVLGGGGGSGSRNNTPGTLYASSGGAGGGLIAIRATSLSGTGTLTARGVVGVAPDNDGGGGGGAGGSILVTTASNSVPGLSCIVDGANGTDAWASTNSASNAHGPGGGGGGGVILTSGVPALFTANPGLGGTTTTFQYPYNSQGGYTGLTNTSANLSSLPGAQFSCAWTPTPSFTISPTFSVSATRSLTYTLSPTFTVSPTPTPTPAVCANPASSATLSGANIAYNQAGCACVQDTAGANDNTGPPSAKGTASYTLTITTPGLYSILAEFDDPTNSNNDELGYGYTWNMCIVGQKDLDAQQIWQSWPVNTFGAVTTDYVRGTNPALGIQRRWALAAGTYTVEFNGQTPGDLLYCWTAVYLSATTPTFTSTVSPTVSPTPTATPTSTNSPSPSTTPTSSATPSSSPTWTGTLTPSPTATITPTVTGTWTATPSASPTSSATPTASPTSTDSPTASPTWTATPTASPTRTASPTASPTWTETPTASPTSTSSPTASPTWTATPTDSPTRTVSPTASPTSTTSPTASPTWTVTPTASPTSTASPTASPTWTATPTASPTASPTSTVTPTASPTRTASPTASPTSTASPTGSPTSTASPTATPTSTASPTASPTSTASPTASPTSTASPTASPTSTASPTASPTSTASPTASPTSTASPTASPTSTASPTASPTSTASPTATPTVSPTDTDTPTASPSASPTSTASPTATPTWTATPTV